MAAAPRGGEGTGEGGEGEGKGKGERGGGTLVQTFGAYMQHPKAGHPVSPESGSSLSAVRR